jgi:tRNA(adenine34) deaminase
MSQTPEAGVPSGYMASYEPSMRLALDLAASRSSDSSSPDTAGPDQDVPVGAVVLGPDGEVAGRGRNQCIELRDPTAHAEIVAIRQAALALGSWRLDGCTLVVTLEPCTMCAGAMLTARIGRLVYGAADERAGAVGSLWDVVRDRRTGPSVEVVSGVLREPCSALLSDFFGRRR